MEQGTILVEKTKTPFEKFTQYAIIATSCISIVGAYVVYERIKLYESQILDLRRQIRERTATRMAWETATQNKVSKLQGQFEASGHEKLSEGLTTCVAEVRRLATIEVSKVATDDE